MEQEITDYLLEKFKPTAILLHGSRATGHARANSDWDIVLLYEAGALIPKNGRVFWREQNIEYSCHALPVEDILKTFGVKLQHARVLYEIAGEGTALLEGAQQEYTKPLNWSAEERANHALWMQGRIDGMKDTLAEPLLFAKYAADFYSRITNYWYWAIHDRYPKPIYIAIEEIAERDLGYLAHIEQFVTGSVEEKVTAAEQIYRHCFG